MTNIVMLVEDNETDEKLAVRALARSGVAHDIVVARDGAEALDYLFATGNYAERDTAAVPAVVLLDLHLPRIDGLEVLRRIRADHRTKHVPVVVLTASKRVEDIERTYALGGNAFVRKSVNFQEFLEGMKTIAAFWLALNEPPLATNEMPP